MNIREWFRPKTPLAWLNLTAAWQKLLLAASGVGFAVLLMFSQIGFRNGLFDSTVQMVRILDGDLFIVSKARYTLSSEQRFDRQELNRAATIPGVHAIQPLYLRRVGTSLRVVGYPSRSIRVIAVPMEGRVFLKPLVDERRDLIRNVGTALLDNRSKRAYGLVRDNSQRLAKQQVELSGKRIQLVDYVEIGTDFVNDGTLIVSPQTFAEYFTGTYPASDPLLEVDFGMVQLEEGADIYRVQRQLQSLAPQYWDVFTKPQIIERDIRFWGQSTPIGIIFTVGTIMGLAVGTIICYQILFTDIADHLAEFATLKAMGYGGGYFVRLILTQSVYLTVLGFIPAAILTVVMFWTLSEITGLVMILTPLRVAMVFGLTLLMCLVGGLLAVRKLVSSDPAALFR